MQRHCYETSEASYEKTFTLDIVMFAMDRCPNIIYKIYDILLRFFFISKIQISLKHTKISSLDYLFFPRGVKNQSSTSMAFFGPFYIKLFFIQRKTEYHNVWKQIIYFIYQLFFSKILFGNLIHKNDKMLYLIFCK